jgi:hypothetical protein
MSAEIPTTNQIPFYNHIQSRDIIVTCDYRRGSDWWVDLVTTYALTTHDYTLQITDPHTHYSPQSITIFISRFKTSRAKILSSQTPIENWTDIKSKSHCDWWRQSVSKSWCRAHDQIFITLWQLRSRFCGAPLKREDGSVLFYMLLALASVVFLGSEYLGTHDHILLPHVRDFPFCRLLRLAGSRWNPELISKSNSRCDWRSVNQ